MPDIEFVDAEDPRPSHRPPAPVDADDADADDAGPREAFGFESVRTWGQPALAVVAAVLTLIAPWRAVYGLEAVGTPGATFFSGAAFSVDGWGRYPSADAGQHGTRYGILLCVAAALLLLGAAASAFGRLRRRPRAAAIAPGVLIAAVGLLAGTIGAAALEVSSTADNFRAQTAGENPTSGADVHIATGSMVWFGLAAVLVGAAAVVVPLLLRARPAPEPEPAAPLALPEPPARPRYVPHADDELLDV